MLHYAVVSPAAIARCHDADVPVWAWTVNERELVGRLIAAGVDGIVTDDPRILAASELPPSEGRPVVNGRAAARRAAGLGGGKPSTCAGSRRY